MLPGVTVDLPPPSGSPQPAPAPQPTSAPEAAAVPPPLMLPYAGQPTHPDHPGFPSQLDHPGFPGQLDHPGPLGLPFAPTGPTGRNGLAIAALCCGIAGLIPLVGVVAIVLGVVALHQLRGGLQRGRGMAITGIVLGALSTLAWTAFIVIAVMTGVTAEPERSPSGQVTGQSQIFVDKLKAGDCFSGGRKDQIDLVRWWPSSSCPTGRTRARTRSRPRPRRGAPTGPTPC